MDKAMTPLAINTPASGATDNTSVNMAGMVNEATWRKVMNTEVICARWSGRTARRNGT